MFRLMLEYFAAACPDTSNFLGFPTWYRGLNCAEDKEGNLLVEFDSITEIWMVVANSIVILIRISGLLAVIFIIYGGFRYITSQGEPDSLQVAKNIITYAIVGLVVAILASTIVGFVAGRL